MGLNVCAMTMDQSSLNKKLWGKLGITITGGPKSHYKVQNIFHLDGKEIQVLSDVPHLLKAIRNALFNQAFLKISDRHVQLYNLTTNEVSVNWIVKMVEFDKKRNLKVASHLSNKILDKGKDNYSKMQVAPAIAVLSRATGQALIYLHEKYPDEFPDKCLATALFCNLCGEYYDIMQSRAMSLAFLPNNPVANNKKEEFLLKFVDFFAAMKLNPNQQNSYWPSQKGVILTTTGILQLQKRLLVEYSLKFFLPGKASNDTMEHFNGEVRKYGKNPTCLQFKRFCRAIFLCNYMKGQIKGAAYEDDETIDCFLTEYKNIKRIEEDLEAEEVKEHEEILDLDNFVKFKTFLLSLLCP